MKEKKNRNVLFNYSESRQVSFVRGYEMVPNRYRIVETQSSVLSGNFVRLNWFNKEITVLGRKKKCPFLIWVLYTLFRRT